MHELDISVIVPVYNSRQTLEELYDRINKVFEQAGKTFEIIFVEDGGTDDSWTVLEKIKSVHHSEVVAIKLARNFGQHNAIFCGLGFVRGSLIVTIDDDLQTPPEEISKLLEYYNANQTDLIYGYYKNKKHSLWRNIGSLYLKKTSRFHSNSSGQGSSFKMFTRDLADKIIQHGQTFVYIDELLLWYTADIAYLEVQHEKRRYSKSGYSFIDLLRLYFNILFYYTAVPLRFMIWGGISGSLLTIIIAVYRIYRWVHFKVPLGYTSIIVTILFSTSLILFSLGIIGEYLNRMYKMNHKKPPFSVKKILR